MLKGNNKITRRAGMPLLGLALSVAALPALAADATTVTALQDTTCGGTRHGSNLGCTANDFVVTASLNSNTITSCHIGDPVVVDVDVELKAGNATRYDVGLFIGQTGNNPQLTGGQCSVATFPFTPLPWFDGTNGGGTNLCGDYKPNGDTFNLVQGVKVQCQADSNGNLVLPYMLAYDNNANGTCSGSGDVSAGTNSKCQGGGIPVTNVVVQFNANPTCGKTVTYNSVAGTVTSTIVVTNGGPDSADGTSFTDTVPGPVVVTGVTCGSATGGAVCGAASHTGNDVSGAITTFPNASTVTFTITSTVAGGLTDTITNTATLAVPAAVITPVEWVKTCTGQTTLPVKLQNFDVK